MMTTDRRKDGRFQILMAAVREGDQQAIAVLHNDYCSHVMAVVRRSLMDALRSKFDSQDFTQVVWMALFSNPEMLDGIQHPSQLSSLLTVIARNKVNDENRRRTQTQKSSVFREASWMTQAEPDLVISGNDPTPSQIAIACETMAQCKANLNREYQRILEMRIDGFTYDAIATELGINERTVRRVLQKLEKGLG
ncbi:MAG: sigma-70 family RNA polymerase sigma factor [Planctomycetaceae bacterium]|nr:sigma-70 family RNA polymerase sigma factor [Planctomycetaceae bacterium]